MARSNRIKRERIDSATRKALELELPIAQIAQGLYALRDVVNHDEQDQREMVRNRAAERDRGSNKGRQTVRRLTRIDKLLSRGVIDAREALACEWYHGAYSARYETVGITARYGEGGGGGCTNFDHLPKTREQRDAYYYFTEARASINPAFLPMFERVVLEGRPLGKLAITFRTVARGLLKHIEGRVSL